MRFQKYNSQSIFLVTTLCLFTITGCMGASNKIVEKPKIAQEALLSGQALFNLETTDLTLPDAGVMKVSDKMRTYLYQNISKSSSDSNKLNNLISLMFSSGNLGIKYDRDQTVTAEGAFKGGLGNCLGVSYLFASLARDIGLTVYFRNVDIPPAWGMEDDTIYRYRHVNIEVSIPRKKPVIIDADEVNNVPTYETNRISTKNAVAQYYSNKGAHYLAKKDTINAFIYFKKAIITDPTQADFWANLGVLYSKNGQYIYAESAYITALNLQNDSLLTMNNMATLYGKMGKDDLKKKYLSLAESQNNKNPYFRFIKASKYFESGDYSNSLSHIQWAIRHEDNDPKFYTLLAQIYKKMDQPDKAHAAQLRAKTIESTIKRLIDAQTVRIKFRSKTWQLSGEKWNLIQKTKQQ